MKTIRHTTAAEIQRAAVAKLHWRHFTWCEETGDWERLDRPDYPRLTSCLGCDQPLTHPNHRWSARRMERDAKEASDRD